MVDQQLVCVDCNAPFTFTEGEQEFYASKGLSAPSRCKPCRDQRKEDRMSERTSAGEMFDATCAQCGAPTKVPFKPRSPEEGGRPVLCSACEIASQQW